MPVPRFEVKIDDGTNILIPFELGMDDKGAPLYTSHLLEPVHISIYSQSEEARYANLLPGVGSVYAQDDLSGGLGKKTQVRREEPEFDRYYYGEWFDASVKGQGQKGPAVTTLTAPANSGPLSGYFMLAGVPYLILGRRIASWASDSLTAVHDYGSGVAGAEAAVFIKLGTESSIEAGAASTAASDLINNADDRLAQSFRIDDTGVRFLSRIDITLAKANLTLTGDVRLSIQADINGKPSGQIITSARQLANNMPTSPASVTFRFDDDDTLALLYNVPYWMVLDYAAATSTLNLAWYRETTTSTYARGQGYVSRDGGNSWTVSGAALEDYTWTLYAKTATTTAFIGTSTGGQFFKSTNDGSTFTSDTYRLGPHFTTVNDHLVRSVADGSASGAIGAIEYSTDGTNWNSDLLVVGDPAVPITWLLTLGESVIACKEDGIYAVDILNVPPDVQPLYASSRVSTNGQGSCVWRGTAYIPFNGRLMAVEGDFSAGFTVHESVGIESLPEWDWPWGQGRHTACVGTRFHLYSTVSSSTGYRLIKSGNPLRKNADGTPNPEWHGSLATIGDGTQTLNTLAVFEPGGSSSPQLFATTTSNNLVRIQLPRSFNPASDSTYSYDTSTVADLYLPWANGNYPVHPKAWLQESATLQRATPGDFVEPLYDNQDGEGWRRLPKGGRMYKTGTLSYPRGMQSLLMARRVRLTNTLSTASPLLQAVGLSYAMRHIPGGAMREITFTVVAENGLSAADLGDILGVGADSQRALLTGAAGTGLGTRMLEDPYGRVYTQVLFLDSTEVLSQKGRETGGRTLIQVSAIGVGT